ncbi:serine acetyltransferase [Maribacter aquivivus]|uniref:serine acetyltransferase n=1 Tax=Maribacter aquivivus TaxID=228958 RepID=UPI00249522D7|nr:serine acetyltransferase [Maribacter aquivivus]
MKFIFQDWKVNSTKGRIIMVFFRLANFGIYNSFYRIISIPYRLFYTFFIEWVLGVELQWRTKAGKCLALHHGQALVVNGNVVLGSNCTLRQSTTIGNKLLSDGSYTTSPIIGDNVDIGSNVCIIGNIIIGDNVKIGSGTVVVKDIPSNSIVVGNPSRVIG